MKAKEIEDQKNWGTPVRDVQPDQEKIGLRRKLLLYPFAFLLKIVGEGGERFFEDHSEIQG